MKKRIGYRIFLVSGDEVAPLTKTAFDDFYFKRQAVLQKFAGKTVDIATVVCRMESTKPEIVRIYCQRFRVNGDGALDGKPRLSSDRSTHNGHEPWKRAAETADQLNGHRSAPSLTMISGAAQKKIFDVLLK